MIRCVHVRISRNRRGQAIREESPVTGAALRIGRGADCNIHFADPRVRLLHASVRNFEDGKLYIDGEGTPLSINGAMEMSAKLRPGMRILIGPYAVNIEAPDAGSKLGDHDFLLTSELVQPLAATAEKVKAATLSSVAATGLSKRRPALMIALLIALLFLVLPMLNALNPALRKATAHAWVALDESWNPGPLSAAHQAFGKQCSECHQRPFVQVRDSACTSCHTGIGDHIQAKAVQTAFFGATRCAECHREHKGLNGLVRSDSSLCVDCHGAIKSKHPDSALPDIHDFASDHPAFSLAFKTGSGPGDVQRIQQSAIARPLENSGLKFPHDVHLAAGGVKGPNGKIVMECRNCHLADESGVRFKPISMQAHCQNCHGLEFEPAVTSRQVPHGSVAEVMTMLNEFYARIALGQTPIDIVTVDGMLRRPGARGGEVRTGKGLDWAHDRAQRVATELFEVRACQVCHTVTKVPDNPLAPWKITPVLQTSHWLTKGRFEHLQHATQKCVVCHDVTRSKRSADVAIPDINRCRDCHSGAKPMRNKIISSCETCHGFHGGDHRSDSGHDTGVMPGKLSSAPPVAGTATTPGLVLP